MRKFVWTLRICGGPATGGTWAERGGRQTTASAAEDLALYYAMLGSIGRSEYSQEDKMEAAQEWLRRYPKAESGTGWRSWKGDADVLSRTIVERNA